jgi:glutamate dehydrogenase (NAD(P)+)
VSAEDGYARYDAFFRAPPLLTLEWRDPLTPAAGVLVINSLRGGAAGGGTRMRRFLNPADPEAVDVAALREEARFLAKTMEIKFRVSGPAIGGAKSVLRFDPADPRKRDVLKRWFAAIAPYLAHRYGTGGDLNVDEIGEVVPLTAEVAGVRHPQEGVVSGHLGATGARRRRILENLRVGLSLPVALPGLPGLDLRLADLATGFGVAEATAAYLEGVGETLAGRRVLVEGFGAVGGSAAYSLHTAGASVVGILCKEGEDYLWATDRRGLDVPALFAGRRAGGLLPASCPRGPAPEPFWRVPADCFVPAARSHAIGDATLDRLREAGVSLVACGANNPFDDDAPGDLAVQRRADRELAVLPDFIASCGMARTFAYLMDESARLEPAAVFADLGRTMRAAVARVLAGGAPRTGLLERSLAAFVPAPGD